MELEEFISDFNAHLSSPESYLKPTEELRGRTLSALKWMFDYYKKFCSEELAPREEASGCRHVDTGPLTELYTEGLNCDQVWEQIELVNKPVLKALSGVVGRLSSKMKRGEFRVFKQQQQPRLGSKAWEKAASGAATQQHHQEEEEEEEEELVQDSAEEDFELEEEGGDCDGGRGKVMGRGSVVDDRFFKLSEMEKFLDLAEKEIKEGKT